MLNSKITESDFSILNTAQLHARIFLTKKRALLGKKSPQG